MVVILEIPHGTAAGYKTFKCKCDLCREYNNSCTQRYREQNRDKDRTYKREWRAANRDSANASLRRRSAERTEFIQTYKMNAGCVDCGFNEHPDALDFDHILERGPKLFEIGRNRTCSMELLLAEIAKCDVVCANHHRIRTANRRCETRNPMPVSQ